MATLFLQVPELKIFTAILDSSLSHSTSKLWARSDPVNFCLSANTLVQIPIISCLDYCYHFLTYLIVTLALLQSSRQPKCHFHSKDMTKSLQQPESLICMTYSPPLFVQPLLVHSVPVTWIPHYPLTVSSTLPPLNLCTGYSLCLECSFFRHPHSSFLVSIKSLF